MYILREREGNLILIVKIFSPLGILIRKPCKLFKNL